MHDEVLERIWKFHTIGNRYLRAFVNLKILPIAVMLWIIVDLLLLKRAFVDNPMLLTGWLAVAAAALLFSDVSHRVPATLETLWVRGLLTEPKEREDRFERALLEIKCPSGVREKIQRIRSLHQGLPKNVQDRYLSYVNGFEEMLNSLAGNLLSGGLVALVIFLALITNARTRDVTPLFVVYYTAALIIAFILGMFLWRMLVIAYQIVVLGKNFDFALQNKHPDGCGGLSILGDLNLINTAIITIPGIYLAGWIIILSNPESVWIISYSTWLPFFQDLLLVVVGLTFFIFLVPLYIIHQEMVLQSCPLVVHLDEVFKKINRLAQELLKHLASLDNSGSGASEEDRIEIDRMKGEIALLQDAYDRNTPVPVWPFNRTIAIKFIVSQSLSLLTLSGIFSKEILQAISSFAGSAINSLILVLLL